MNIKDLHITDSLQKLDIIAQKDDVIRNLKKVHKFTQFANKMMAQLLQCQDDQEKCYILCRRYIRLMDHLFQITDDRNYCQSLHMGDYRRVNQLLEELRASLNERYQARAMARLQSTISNSVSSPTARATKMQNGIQDIGDIHVFKDKFILPNELHNILQRENNFLLVDIRAPSEFETCRISAKRGTIVNIPGDVIVPGLSANTLGLRLDSSLRDIWNKRDKFDIIIFMDNDTQKHNYVGSKLERLRSFIVEWDALRNYKQEPVVLNGGLREFVEWYPATVDNSQVFLSQTNAEIDELLDIDSITYPESGSTKQMNLKIHANATSNLEHRIKRDFKEEDEDDESKLQSLSEGHLPLDFYVSKDTAPISRYKSLSQENLRKDLDAPELQELFPHILEGEQIQKPKPEVDAAEIKEILEGDKAALLREARKAAKPKFSLDESQDKGDRKIDKPDVDRGAGPADRDAKPETKPAPPTVDRTFKPVLTIGEGYTGLRNIRNICYMNGLLQCLKVIPVIKTVYVTTDRYISFATRTPPKMNNHFSKVLRELWGGTPKNPKTFLIQDFKNRVCEFAPMYNKNTHEDCFEFFMFLFNALSEDCSVDLSRPKIMTESEKAWYGHLQGRSSLWVDNFYYQLKNTKYCCNCRKVNLSFETDSTLMLPVDTGACYLKDMVAEYLKENKLTDFSCSHCKSTGAIVNRKELVVEPEVLVVVLKRYIANPEDGTIRKNEAEVDFPLHDLKFGNSRYNLYGVVQHTGTMSFGHYFAAVLLNDKKGTWVSFNDETITCYSSAINELPHVKSAAAGFFYVRNTR